MHYRSAIHQQSLSVRRSPPTSRPTAPATAETWIGPTHPSACMGAACPSTRASARPTLTPQPGCCRVRRSRPVASARRHWRCWRGSQPPRRAGTVTGASTVSRGRRVSLPHGRQSDREASQGEAARAVPRLHPRRPKSENQAAPLTGQGRRRLAPCGRSTAGEVLGRLIGHSSVPGGHRHAFRRHRVAARSSHDCQPYRPDRGRP